MVERKHDGWRMFRNRGRHFTRNGIPFRGISHIERAAAFLQQQFNRPMFFDGEFTVGTGIDTLAQTKAHQDHGWREGDAGTFWIFDCLPMSDWEFAESDTPLVERKAILKAGIDRMMADPLSWEFGWADGTECPLRYVEDQWADSAYDVRDMARSIWAEGGEGVVVKDPMAPYRRNRNEAWLKLRLDIEKRKSYGG